MRGFYIGVFAAFFLAQSSLAKEQLLVGFASQDITPETGPIYLAGFQNNRPAQGVNDPLYAIASVIEQGDERLALVAIDAIGFMIEEVQDIKEALPASWGISKLIIHSTHTHSAPDTQGLWGPNRWTSGINQEHMQLIHSRILTGIGQALEQLRPASLWYASIFDEELEATVRDTRPPYVKDPGLHIVQFRDMQDESVIGTMVNWGNHPETSWAGHNLISADFPAYVRTGISEGLSLHGEPVHNGLGGTTMFLTGNVGGLMSTTPSVPVRDIITGQLYTEPGFDKVRAQGHQIAKLVLDCFEQGDCFTPSSNSDLRVYSSRFEVQIKNNLFTLAAIGGVLRRDVAWFRGRRTTTEVNLVTLGDIWMSMLPGELYPEIAVGGIENPVGADFNIAPVEVPPLREMAGGKLHLMVNLANDSVGYIIPKSQWDSKSPHAYGENAPYGEEVSLGPDTAPKVHAELLRLYEQAIIRE